MKIMSFNVIGLINPKKKSDNVFLLKRKETLSKLRNSNKISVVTGDFNYDILKYIEKTLFSVNF